MRPAFAALLLLASQAQAQQVVELRSARLVQLDGGVVDVTAPDGGTAGVYLDVPELLREAEEHRMLRTDNQHLREHAADIPAVYLWAAAAVGAVLGTITGVVVGYEAGRR